jgi:general secretion pathway protein G
MIAPQTYDVTELAAEVIGIEHDDFELTRAARTVDLRAIPFRFEAGLIQGLLELNACTDVSHRDQDVHVGEPNTRAAAVTLAAELGRDLDKFDIAWSQARETRAGIDLVICGDMRHRRLVLSRNPERGMTLLEIMIVLAILALVMGIIVGPRVMALFADSKVEIAKIKIQKLANEGYPQWAMRNPGKDCPERIDELSEVMNAKPPHDPWGQPYRMLCPPNLPPGVRTIAIVSSGPDKKEGTDDDIKSW